MDAQTVVNTLWDKIRIALGDKISAASDSAAAAKTSETNAKASETAVSNALSTKSDVGHSHAWSTITSKPTTFTPATHAHAWNDITSKPSTFTPATHVHAQADITGLSSTLAGKADLVGGVVPTSQIPAIALTKPFSVASRSAMLALDAQEGDIAVIATGADKGTYILGDGPKGTFSSWISLATDPAIPVQSVNGQTGTIVLSAANVGAAPTSHNHPVTDITATGTRGATTYLRGDGTWTVPPNTDTTYALPTQAEAEAGTATTTRVWSAQRVSQAIAALAAPKTHTHTTAQVTGLDSALSGKANSAHSHPVTDITATGTRSASTYLRGDGSWVTPTNTTYSAVTQADAEAGTVTSSKVWSPQRVAQAIAAQAAPKTHTHTSEQISDATFDTEAWTVVRRDGNGDFYVKYPVRDEFPTPKSYVDAQVATHKHTMAQITNLPTVSSESSQNTIAQRDASGNILVGLSPIHTNHAASRFYVDNTRKGVIHSGTGGVPTTIPNAVAGDFWLNTSTMELHKITAV